MTEYVFQFDIASIILTLMLLYTMLMRRNYPTKACQTYKLLLLFNLLSSVFDLISAFTIPQPDLVPLWMNYVINMGYLGFHNLTGVVFLLFILTAVRGNYGNKIERFFWVGAVALVVLPLISSPFTGLIFYFDESMRYCHGPFLPILYVTAAVIVLYAIVLIWRHSSVMSEFQVATDTAFVILLIGSIIFQMTFPNILIENFCIAVACLMMNVALDNPALYFYKSTGCYNQTAFAAKIDEKIRKQEKFSIVAFTFDDMAIFSKKYGEAAFDLMAYATIDRLNAIVGYRRVFLLSNMTFALYVEDECPDALIEKVEKEVSKPIKLSDEDEVYLSPHFCILHMPGPAENAGEIIVGLQDMLDHVYRKTGNHVVWDSSKLLEAKHREDMIVHILHDAVQDNGFQVLYQPIRDNGTGKFESAEALVRLINPELKIYPDEFIPIAEQNGIILDIGEIVLRKVCHFIRESRCSDFGLIRINVNLSMLQLIRRSSVERLAKICEEEGVSAEQIVFEMTETATADILENAVLENLEYLRQKGFTFSLDDYGSGYSNLSQLSRFPFTQIKVDKSILWSAVGNKVSRVILENTVGLIHGLGKNCVAEGVENEEMVKFLSALKVDKYQGYLYSRPLSGFGLLAFIIDKNGESKKI